MERLVVIAIVAMSVNVAAAVAAEEEPAATAEPVVVESFEELSTADFNWKIIDAISSKEPWTRDPLQIGLRSHEVAFALVNGGVGRVWRPIFGAARQAASKRGCVDGRGRILFRRRRISRGRRVHALLRRR